jgi:hypothetical protein
MKKLINLSNFFKQKIWVVYHKNKQVKNHRHAIIIPKDFSLSNGAIRSLSEVEI